MGQILNVEASSGGLYLYVIWYIKLDDNAHIVNKKYILQKNILMKFLTKPIIPTVPP